MPKPIADIRSSGDNALPELGVTLRQLPTQRAVGKRHGIFNAYAAVAAREE